ncbi:hypothetical protein EP331_08765 [bacterium]|nr:MAG: hypothetical protein EP331_08765 [bacterium]
MSVIFLFVDGIGLAPESEWNPFSLLDLPGLEEFSGGKLVDSTPYKNTQHLLFKAIDANLDVEGLPQSGTGQASLFCGFNASKKIGKHFGPYPHSQTKEELQNESIFSDLIKMGKSPHFINAYPQPFFDIAERRNRWTSTTLMALGAGKQLNSLSEIEKGLAVTAEIKQDYWKKKLGLSIPEVDEFEAAKRIVIASKKHDFVLYEYYLTDKAGHDQKLDSADEALSRLDKLVQGLLKEIDIATQTVVLTSDHGNLEDLSVKTHTRNPVPLIAYGKKASVFSKVESLTDIKKAVLDCFL